MTKSSSPSDTYVDKTKVKLAPRTENLKKILQAEPQAYPQLWFLQP
jgi:hypothetical protein